MPIPNTTSAPNILFDSEMKKMNDTELRIVLTVIRSTLGWEIEGERKKQDWISYYQLKQKTGRGYTAIARAIDNAVKQNWLELRDEKGNILDAKNKRIGKKIFYRLGTALSEEVVSPTSIESKEVKPLTSPQNVITESVITESGAYKTNTIQNKNITKVPTVATQGVAASLVNLDKNLNSLIVLFKTVNPMYERLFINKTERMALERLVNKFGIPKVQEIIRSLPKIIYQKTAPRITTPLELERNLGKLIIFIQQERSANKFHIGTVGN